MRTSWVSCTAVALLLLEDADVEAFRAKYSMPASGCSHRVGTLPQSSVAHRAAPGAPGPVISCADGCGHLLSVGKAGAMTSVSLTRGSVRSLLCNAGGNIDEEDFEVTMQRLTRILEQDLPLQYEKPQDLSIFGDGVEFQDPVTTLRGKLPYRGMLCEYVYTYDAHGVRTLGSFVGPRSPLFSFRVHARVDCFAARRYIGDKGKPSSVRTNSHLLVVYPECCSTMFRQETHPSLRNDQARGGDWLLSVS
ncbi:unnamed protein product [Ectocarpus sp. 4 AP-2014]